jgi:hypothetical protein
MTVTRETAADCEFMTPHRVGRKDNVSYRERRENCDGNTWLVVKAGAERKAANVAWRDDILTEMFSSDYRFIFAPFLFLALASHPSRAHAQSSEACGDCILSGQVGAQFPGKGFVPASGAKVYIFYQSEFVNEGIRNRHFTPRYSFYTAGGQFHGHYVDFVSNDRDLKPLIQKQKKKQEFTDEEAMRFAERSLKHADEAIAAVMDWKAKHPKDEWQVRVVIPDEQGRWTSGPLEPGTYQVIARGIVSRLDSDWEYEIDVEPDKKTDDLNGRPHLFLPITSQSSSAR